MQRIGEIISNQKSPKSPSSPANSYENEKNRKYDRQLRIWGDNGQYLIEMCNVCLLNANSTGTEILKNLVLAGIGSFTVVDGNKVTSEDDNNFFCDRNSLGKNRAQTACSSLLELNPDVTGDYIEETPERLLETNAKVFNKFSIVIAANFYHEKSLIKLSHLLWELNIPLILAYSLGFVGLIRIQVCEHPVIESHPDNFLEDLRLDKPFEELKEYLDSYEDLISLDRKRVSRVPFIVVLYKFLKEWQDRHGKSPQELPSNFKEKEEIRNLIRDSMKLINERTKSRISTTDDEFDGELELENFREAIKAVNTTLVKSDFMPIETSNILQDPCVEKVLNEKVYNTSFWLLIRALKLFLRGKSQGCLPVRGSIPDMTADTQSYVTLQKIYSTKAKQDMDSIISYLSTICDDSERSLDMISEEKIRAFCRNTHCLRLIRTSPVFSELSSTVYPPYKPSCNHRLKDLINCPDSNGDENNGLMFYLMIRAVGRFYTVHNRFPGYYNDQVESDIVALKTCFKDVLNDLGCNYVSKDDFIHEMCRYGGSELHSVSAFVGGSAAQEAIKFITKQFVPLESILIYNALSSTTTTYNW